MKKNYKLMSRLATAFACLTMAFSASAQTTLINPLTEGGFENGSTFTANGWSSSSSANNPWVVGTAVSSGAITGNSAYISNDGGVTNTYTPTDNANNFFWRDITVPAGETKIFLTFNWRSEGEASWDNIQVFTAPTSITPVGVNTHPGSGTTNVPAGIAGATNIGFYQMGGATTVNAASIQLSPSLAGTTFRLIFSWKNETGGAQPPAAIDNISLISQVPGNFISIITGNWSSPSTWDANAVPTYLDNVTISTGHVVTLNAAGPAANNVLIDGTLTFGTVPTGFTANGNLTVNASGIFEVFNGTTGKNLTVSGNITNNGLIDLSKGTSTTTSVLTLNGTTVQTVSGTGAFATNIVRNLTFNNTSTAIPNINWLFNNISVGGNLIFTSGKVNLSTNKMTLGTGTTSGTGAGAVGSLTAPVGQGFMPGGTFSRWYTTASTGTTITAGTDPTNATSRYPFLNATAQNRAMYITRASGGTSGGQLSVKYNDGTGMSNVSFTDGAYNIDKIYNGNWVVSTEGTGIASASYGAYIIGQGAYTAANGNTRIVSNTTAITGTNQLGTTTPAGYRTGISLSDLTNPAGLYLGISNADLLFPCAGTPTAGTISGPATVCAGAPFTLSLSGASSGETGLTYQWQSSTDGLSYSNISGANSMTYAAPPIIAPTYYQVIVTCTNSSSSVTTPPVQVGFTHSVTGISPASRCGTGTVTLGATGSAGTNLVWYSASSGGMFLGSGTSFVTPVISSTTSFYVGAGTSSAGTSSIGNGGTTGTSAAYNFTNGGYGGMKTQYLYTASELTLAGIAPGNITSLAFDFTAVGATLNGFNVEMGSSSLTTFTTPISIAGGLTSVYSAASMTAVVGTNTFTLTTPFNWDGSSNIIISISWSNNNTSNTSSTIRYDATTNYSSQSYRKDSETAANIYAFSGSTATGTYAFDRSLFRPRITFGGNIQCTSPLSEVVATVNTPPSVAVTASPSTICAGGSSSLDATSSNAGYTYTWMPGSLTGATASVSPSVTTTYTVSAVDVSGGANDGCATTGTITVNVTPLPVIQPATATPSAVCTGGSSQLEVLYAPASNYCIPTMSSASASGDYLKNFTFGSISNLNSNDAPSDYTYYSGMTANVTAGTPVPFTLEAGGTTSTYAMQFRIWIDYNQNGIFEASESAYNTTSATFSPTVVSGSLTVPASAFNGLTRMRVMGRYSTTPGTSEVCLGASTYGEYEDYNVNISGATANPGFAYSWSPTTFLNDATIANPMASAATATTTYTVSVTASGCTSTESVTLTVNALPTVTAMSDDANDAVCAGSSVTLNGGGASTYTWTGSVANNTAFTPSATDTYTVTGTDANGCMNTASITVTVNALPTVTAMSDDANDAVCAGSSVTLNGGGASTYTWTGSVANNTAFTPSATDTYTVTGTDANGCTNTNTITITVNPLPVVALGADYAACASTTLNAGNAGATYLWSDNSTAQTLTVTASGTYSVTVTDAITSCSASDAIDITINANPVVALGADFTACGSATLDAGNAGATYLWNDNSTAQTLNVTSTGTYSVTVTDVTTSCTASDVIDVTINALPVVALGSDITQCGGSTTLDAGNAGATYLWSDNSTDQTLVVTTTGTYSVTVTDATTSCTASDAIDVTINSNPVVALGTDFTACGSATLDAGNAGATYLWNDNSTGQTLEVTTTGSYSVTVTDVTTSCTGTDMIDVTINPLPTVVFTPFTVPVCDNGGPVSLTGGSPAGGVYSGTGVSGITFDPTGLSGMVLLTYTVTDVNSCTNSDTASITVDLCSGIASANSINEFNVYPNPANGMISVSITNANAEVINISIVDLQGKEVYNSTNTNVQSSFTKQINIEAFAKGVYYVKLSTENTVKINKLIVH